MANQTARPNSRLNPREKFLVMLAALVVVFGGGYRFVWQPVMAERTALVRDIAAFRQLAATARAHESGGAPIPAATPDLPLATRVTASAQEVSIPLRRLEPEGERLRVTLEEVAFDEVVAWLARLEQEYNIRLAAVEIDRRTLPGMVSARITLEPST